MAVRTAPVALVGEVTAVAARCLAGDVTFGTDGKRCDCEAWFGLRGAVVAGAVVAGVAGAGEGA